MVATLYAYSPGFGRTLKNGVRQMAMNQDDGDAADVRLAAANTQLQTVMGTDPTYLKTEETLGLPTGGVLAGSVGDARIYARDEIIDIIA